MEQEVESQNGGVMFYDSPPTELLAIETKMMENQLCHVKFLIEGGKSSNLLLPPEQARELHHQTGEYIDKLEKE
jgi:hypothetical protein